MNSQKIRIDDLLVELSLAEDKKQAQALVLAGKVYCSDRKFTNPSQTISRSSKIFCKSTNTRVGRGGLKLESAIKDLQIENLIVDKVVLDIGCSTGGFTQCLLEHHAKHVIALDVGSNQLDWRIRKDNRVTTLEKTNIKDFNNNDFPQIDFITADISFNSLSRLAQPIAKALGSEGKHLLLLVKPQFELAARLIPDGGIVTDATSQQQAVDKVTKTFKTLNFSLIATCKSKVKGTSGNQEFFSFFKRDNF